MCFEIREAILGDINSALKLDREVFGPDAWTLLDYIGVFFEKSVAKFTALVNGMFAGFAAAEMDTKKGSSCLLTLAVLPEYRGKGIGSALLKQCEDAFGSERHYLYVDIENTPAISLYEKSGYILTGRIHAYYMNGHDALVYEK